ncbi:MAG: salicylate 1-monooxygenase [Comamonadaceae bacterium]|nr:MAG: salicylate 1-monooxygenase [Comamonadaceae bacterium]
MNAANMKRIAIVGAGIGGLCAASLMAKRGMDVIVLEQASSLGEVGAGLQIGPNGVKVLRALGLRQALEEIGVRPAHLVLKDWKTGVNISRTGIAGDFDKAYGAPYYHVHRADLLEMLRQSASGLVDLRVGTRVHDVEAAGRLVKLQGIDPPVDAVIGADGIHSAVRRNLHGEQAPRFTGNVAYRALIPVDAEIRRKVPMDSTIWIGPGAHVVHYYVRGGELLNIVAVVETDRWTDESWTQPAAPDELQAAFRGWNRSLLALLDRVTHTHRWALYDRDPLEFWGSGAATLLGDAAHPMLPFLAQGAVMAMEDAYVLADELSPTGDVTAALRRYEARRMKRTSRLQMAARARGEAMHIASWSEAWRRNAKLFIRSRFTRDDQIKKGQALYGYDVTGSNTQDQRATGSA